MGANPDRVVATTTAPPDSASSGSGPSLRIECRIPGADCNPYLAYAAILAAGLDGIANETEPPDQFTGDVYQARDLPRRALTPSETQPICSLQSSDFDAAAFGDDVVEHYTHFIREEQRHSTMPSPTGNGVRYFERI